MRLLASVWPVTMVTHSFMRNAFIGGTLVAVACGLVGYFLVMRGQVFTGDALSHAAFTGALAGLAIGVDLRHGLFVVTVAVALGMGLLGRSGKADDVVIGAVFVWLLGLGVLFLSIYASSRSGAGANGAAGVGVLFGSIFGLSGGDVVLIAAVNTAVALGVLAIARPLLFSSIDAGVAAGRGVPVRALGIAFLGLVGLTAATTTPVVGALPLLGLLAAPGAAAQRLTSRPFRGLVVSAGIAVGVTWVGLTLSYELPRVPPSFTVVVTAVSVYGASHLRTPGRHGQPILIHSHSA